MRVVSVLTTLLLASAAVAVELKPLESGLGIWFGDPLTWGFEGERVVVKTDHNHAIAEYRAAPLAGEVSIEATLVPERTAARGWSVAAIAIVDDAHNFWHLALVEAPPESGGRHQFELCEMLNGEWLSQQTLKQEAFDVVPGATWEFGKSYRLQLKLGEGGVSGRVFNQEGQQLWHSAYSFGEATAVKCGRPGLRVGDFSVSYSEVKAGWSKEQSERALEITPYVTPASGLGNFKSKASGFFRVEQQADGRWWVIDPLGQSLVVLGVDHVKYSGHPCEKLGYQPYRRKNDARYANWQEWESETLGRLKAWGFNALGAGCDMSLKHRGLLHTEFLNIGDHLASLDDELNITPNEKRPCSSFPNVFHPDFKRYAEFRARQSCVKMRNDPWLLGYFIDNELAWWGRGPMATGLADAAMKKGGNHSAKVALKELAQSSFGGKIAEFNKAFGLELKAFDEIVGLEKLSDATERGRELKLEYLRLAAERYFKITSEAIRAVDPNHIVMGARFAGIEGAHPVVWEVAGKYCELVTFNIYPFAELDEGVVYNNLGVNRKLSADQIEELYGHVKRPMLITEWSFPALDAGLPSMHGAGQRFYTQAERTQATELFARTTFSSPFLLGYNYFMWVDEPALGISTPFPEDSNYGLVSEDGVPYKLITEMFARVHKEAGKLRHKPLPKPLKSVARRSVPAPLKVMVRAGGGKGVLSLVREGEHYRIGERVVLQGKVGRGNMVDALHLAGHEKSLGAYNAMLHVKDEGGMNRWLDTLELTGVSARQAGSVTVVELRGERREGKRAFELTHTLYMLPDKPWFICEWSELKNLGEEPLDVKGIYFRLYAPFSEGIKTVPNLWRRPPADLWFDSKSGEYCGFVAPRDMGGQVYFWTDGEGGRSLHPDARMQFDDLVVAPGTSYKPTTPIYMVCVVGTDGTEGWLRMVDELSDLTVDK